jgi:molecular chaperone DnaK
MVEDAKLNETEDKRIKDLVNTRNQGEALVHNTRKSLTEYSDKITPQERETIELAIKSLEENLKNEDKTIIESKIKELIEASKTIGEKIYTDQKKTEKTTNNKEEDTVETEYKDVKDKP